MPAVESGHYLLPRLLKLLRAGFHVYLWGPAGSGKTSGALMAAKALERAAELDTLDPSTFRSMVQGYRTPEGEPVHTAFTRCWEAGAVYVADELDNAPGHVQTLFNAALANGHAPLAWGSVDRRETFGFVGTGNTPGRPTRAFPDRRPMSAAFTDRLYFLFWPIDPAIECRAVGLPLPKPPKRRETTCTPAQWVTWVQTVRSWAETNAPTLLVTPRASLDGIRALALGETPEEVADGLVFRGCDAEMRAKVLYANQLPVAATAPTTPVATPTDDEPDHGDDVIPTEPTSTTGLSYAVVTGTKWTDHETRNLLKSHGGRWDKRYKQWRAYLPTDVISSLRSRGLEVSA